MAQEVARQGARHKEHLRFIAAISDEKGTVIQHRRYGAIMPGRAAVSAMLERRTNLMVPRSDLCSEADKLAAILVGKRVRGVKRHRDGEVLIEFEDDTRFFVNSRSHLEFSITGGQPEQAPTDRGGIPPPGDDGLGGLRQSG